MSPPAETASGKLSDPVTSLRGVGPKVAERLQRIGVVTIRDLLFHLPFRYQDRTHITPIGAARVGTETLIVGEIELTQLKYGRRRSLLVRIADGTGAIILRFFHFSRSQQNNLQKGMRLRCFGDIRHGPSSLEMVHPEYTRIGNDSTEAEERLTPVYPVTDGINQPSLRKLTDQALQFVEQLDADQLPPSVAEQLGALPTLADAIRFVHRPPPEAPVDELMAHQHKTQQRLAIDELLAHHLSLRRVRSLVKSRSAPKLSGGAKLNAQLTQALPFTLTAAQQRVLDEIQKDLATGQPMLRLVQGDVGSGKTVVAALASLAAFAANYQVAVMAPTELLAEQHLRSFSQWLEPLGIPVIWLSGKLTRSKREAALAAIESQTPALIVGTHALFQADVEFANLGVVIIDEQHRFGVQQRLLLRDKGASPALCPHQLIMTATPIPRTLAMTAYAELDTSIIDELPPHRQAVKTSVIPSSRRAQIIERIDDACHAGRQIYWVCTLIEESDALQAEAATDAAATLAESLPNARVGLIHGRMKSAEKERVMAEFSTGKLDLLVATTVIEVGVDVPNATLMIIENAERLGLAQLHQLRGRVGRGHQASDCVLLYQAPLSKLAKERLAILRNTTDGFVIAERDLELRGPGELLGTRQAGLAELRIANLARDRALLPTVNEVAELLLDQFPDQVNAIVQRWLGNQVDYLNA